MILCADCRRETVITDMTTPSSQRHSLRIGAREVATHGLYICFHLTAAWAIPTCIPSCLCFVVHCRRRWPATLAATGVAPRLATTSALCRTASNPTILDHHKRFCSHHPRPCSSCITVPFLAGSFCSSALPRARERRRRRPTTLDRHEESSIGELGASLSGVHVVSKLAVFCI